MLHRSFSELKKSGFGTGLLEGKKEGGPVEWEQGERSVSRLVSFDNHFIVENAFPKYRKTENK